MRSCVCGGNWGRRRSIAILFVELAAKIAPDERQFYLMERGMPMDAPGGAPVSR
jgi:hypothetical protein